MCKVQSEPNFGGSLWQIPLNRTTEWFNRCKITMKFHLFGNQCKCFDSDTEIIWSILNSFYCYSEPTERNSIFENFIFFPNLLNAFKIYGNVHNVSLKLQEVCADLEFWPPLKLHRIILSSSFAKSVIDLLLMIFNFVTKFYA